MVQGMALHGNAHTQTREQNTQLLGHCLVTRHSGNSQVWMRASGALDSISYTSAITLHWRISRNYYVTYFSEITSECCEKEGRNEYNKSVVEKNLNFTHLKRCVDVGGERERERERARVCVCVAKLRL